MYQFLKYFNFKILSQKKKKNAHVNVYISVYVYYAFNKNVVALSWFKILNMKNKK